MHSTNSIRDKASRRWQNILRMHCYLLRCKTRSMMFIQYYTTFFFGSSSSYMQIINHCSQQWVKISFLNRPDCTLCVTAAAVPVAVWTLTETQGGGDAEIPELLYVHTTVPTVANLSWNYLACISWEKSWTGLMIWLYRKQSLSHCSSDVELCCKGAAEMIPEQQTSHTG